MRHTVSALDYVDAKRRNIRLPNKQYLGQYFSSAPLARLLASMMDYPQSDVSILDPGAGVGSLFTACVEAACRSEIPPRRISITAYEVDTALANSLDDSLNVVEKFCRNHGVQFSGNLIKRDFIMDHCRQVTPGEFTHVIMNPPYRKISTSSQLYAVLRKANLQTVNTYVAFIAISQNLLCDRGQMVFISPRSFCNGSYFERFRKHFLESASIRRIHLFNSRTSSFRDDGVLQENVVIYSEKHGRRRPVVVSSSNGPQDRSTSRLVAPSEVIFDDDPRHFIHIVPDEAGSRASSIVQRLECALADLGMHVSTGRVVDFRVRSELRRHGSSRAIPLIRSFNISGGTVAFPIENKKHHNFIRENKKSKNLLVKNDTYVLVKRFTTVEEKKRLVAAVWTGKEYGTKLVGFENSTNYFHRDGRGLDLLVAKGLWAFLNSTVVDLYFRQFNGSTHVNAGDLRYIRYPSEDKLKCLGNAVPDGRLDQKFLDGVVEKLLFRS